jgi:hypothetical protein
MRLRLAFVGFLLSMSAAGEAEASWNEPSAGSLNVGTLDSDSASTTTAGGTPYVAWNENDGSRYNDSQAAKTTFTVQRRTLGRRKGGACVKTRKRPPRAKRCTRYVKVGSFSHTDTAGPNRLRFSGRVGGRKLKPGAYRLRAVPRNSAGAGKAVTRGFRVKKS